MADYKTIITFNKDGSVFSTLQEAYEQHVSDCSSKFGSYTPAITSLSDYEGYVAGQTMFTETRALVTGETPVASGLAGNGYQLTRVWNEAKLITEVDSNGWPNTDDLETNGWSMTAVDYNADTGVQHTEDYQVSVNEIFQ